MITYCLITVRAVTTAQARKPYGSPSGLPQRDQAGVRDSVPGRVTGKGA
jgi:hypothetical protein